MKSLAEQQQEYLSRPDVRTMPLSEAEIRVADEFDADRQAGNIPGAPPSIPPNDELLIKYFMLGNYIVSRDGLLTAIQALRPLFSREPGPVEESKASYSPDNAYLRTQGLQSATQRHADNEKIVKESDAGIKKLLDEGMKKQRGAAFMERLREVSGIVVGTAIQGVRSHGDTHRAKIQAFEAAKADFSEPEFVQELNKRIEKEREHLRW